MVVGAMLLFSRLVKPARPTTYIIVKLKTEITHTLYKVPHTKSVVFRNREGEHATWVDWQGAYGCLMSTQNVHAKPIMHSPNTDSIILLYVMRVKHFQRRLTYLASTEKVGVSVKFQASNSTY